MDFPENFNRMRQETLKEKRNLQSFIGQTLRWGVSLACAVAMLGGILYLISSGSTPMPDYTSFQQEPDSYTTLRGIWEGVCQFRAKELIQLGVVLLILTPIFRVILSLVGFWMEHDWLYVAIAAVVLLVIFSNMMEGA